MTDLDELERRALELERDAARALRNLERAAWALAFCVGALLVSSAIGGHPLLTIVAVIANVAVIMANIASGVGGNRPPEA